MIYTLKKRGEEICFDSVELILDVVLIFRQSPANPLLLLLSKKTIYIFNIFSGFGIVSMRKLPVLNNESVIKPYSCEWVKKHSIAIILPQKN